tara:strand:+ start:676 stop:1413 length:738 start_codon:yes stop_codon:yes gene_type:complete
VSFELLPSIHDVMPHNLDRVEAILEEFDRAGLRPVTLLVVPGLDWQARDLQRLRAMLQRGHELAGHGWHHRMAPPRSLYQRLHSALLSRGVAEHLPLDEASVVELVQRCQRWFGEHALPAPALYVPPAWALGRIAPARLDGCGFRYIETLAGIHDLHARRLYRLPLVGFEADTAVRAAFLRGFNAVNRGVASARGVLRLGVHPRDRQLRLRRDLAGWLSTPRPVTCLERLGARRAAPAPGPGSQH